MKKQLLEVGGLHVSHIRFILILFSILIIRHFDIKIDFNVQLTGQATILHIKFTSKHFVSSIASWLHPIFEKSREL